MQPVISATAVAKPDVALAHQVSRRPHAPQPINKAEKDAILTEFHDRHPLRTINKYTGEPSQVARLKDAKAAVKVVEPERTIRYPSAATLYRTCRMQQEIGRSWTWNTESTTEYCLFAIVKDQFLGAGDTAKLRSLNSAFRVMVDSVMKAKGLDFTPLRISLKTTWPTYSESFRRDVLTL